MTTVIRLKEWKSPKTHTIDMNKLSIDINFGERAPLKKHPVGHAFTGHAWHFSDPLASHPPLSLGWVCLTESVGWLAGWLTPLAKEPENVSPQKNSKFQKRHVWNCKNHSFRKIRCNTSWTLQVFEVFYIMLKHCYHNLLVFGESPATYLIKYSLFTSTVN